MWQLVFWSSLALVLYSYAGYPLVLFLAAKLRRAGRRASHPDHLPSVCLLISAFNEEKVIRKKIENSLGLDYPRDRLTILVASDGSNDQTVAIVEDYADLGVRLFHRPARSGKSAVLNAVVNTIRDDVVVFTDANAMFAEDALKNLVSHFADPEIGCVVGKLRYVERHTTSVAKGEGLYWRYEGMLSVLESSLKSVLVANGSIFAIRRDLFPDLYPEVANDFQIPIEIGARGYGVIYEPRSLAFEQSTALWQEEFERKVRIIVRGLSGLWRLRSRITGFRRWQFVSHKLLRWAVGPILVVTLVSNAVLMRDSLFYLFTMMGQLFVYLAALNGWRMRKTRRSHPLFYLPFYFTMVNLAAVVAFIKFLSGERRSVWEKAESARMAPAASPGRPVVTALRPRVAREARLGPSREIRAADIAGKVAKS
jgi:biofilm PGA synthesis N-glycosyltransferase PgaC